MQTLPVASCGQCRAPVPPAHSRASWPLLRRAAVLLSHPAQHSTAAAAPRHRVCATNGAASETSAHASPDAGDDSEEALEAKMNEFLRQQALQESGETYVQPASTGSRVLGAEAVTDEEAKQYCVQVRDMIKLLKANRDMAFNEIKLTIAIEDPRARERRENLGIEEDSGVSRDELAAALTEVAEGRLPKDRIALRELAREMAEWPYADLSTDSRLEQLKDVDPEEEKGVLRPRKLIGRDKNEAPQGVADLLPDWVGYGALYAVSAAPVIIGIGVITVLFLNSVK